MLRSLHYVVSLTFTANALVVGSLGMMTVVCSLLLSAWLGLQSQTYTQTVLCVAHPPPKKSTSSLVLQEVLQGEAWCHYSGWLLYL